MEDLLPVIYSLQASMYKIQSVTEFRIPKSSALYGLSKTTFIWPRQNLKLFFKDASSGSAYGKLSPSVVVVFELNLHLVGGEKEVKGVQIYLIKEQIRTLGLPHVTKTKT